MAVKSGVIIGGGMTFTSGRQAPRVVLAGEGFSFPKKPGISYTYGGPLVGASANISDSEGEQQRSFRSGMAVNRQKLAQGQREQAGRGPGRHNFSL